MDYLPPPCVSATRCLFLYVSSVMDWWPVQGLTSLSSCLMTAGIGPSPPLLEPERTSSTTTGWMEIASQQGVWPKSTDGFIASKRALKTIFVRMTGNGTEETVESAGREKLIGALMEKRHKNEWRRKQRNWRRNINTRRVNPTYQRWQIRKKSSMETGE